MSASTIKRLCGLVLVVGFMIAGWGQEALAQNRLSAEGGALFPLGSFGDGYDTSLYIGARFEFQDTNALGQVAVLSYMLRAGYVPLRVKDSVKSALEMSGQSTDSYMFNAGGGIRAYSSRSPVFLSLGLQYLNLDPAGSLGSQSGFDTALGVGLTWGRESVILEVEAQGHAAFFSDIDNIQYVVVQGNVGIPF
jgi:hypothetical protein